MDRGQPTVEASRLVALAVEATEAHREALTIERDRRGARDRAIVVAVRAGARLSSIAEAAGITRAAASLISRQTLAPRTGRGGPYARQRGVARALHAVAETTSALAEARTEIVASKARRDAAIVASVVDGEGVTQTARAVGLTSSAVSEITRRSVSE